MGLSFEIPEGYYGQIFSRSGQSLRGLIVLAGVVDRNYTGVVNVILTNIGTEDIIIEVGERVAQIVFIRIWEGELVEVDTLHQSDRNNNGFGSTGMGQTIKSANQSSSPQRRCFK